MRANTDRQFRRYMLASAVAAATGWVGQSAMGLTYTWVGGGNNANWTASNWAGGFQPSSNAQTQLIFPSLAAPATSVQNIADPFTLNVLAFSGVTNGYAISGQPLRFVANGAGIPVLVQNSSAAQSFSQRIYTDADMLITGSGAGTLTFSGLTTSGVEGHQLTISRAGLTRLSGDNSIGSLTVNGASISLGSGRTDLVTSDRFDALSVTAGGQMFIQDGAYVESASGATRVNGPAGSAIVVDGPGTTWYSGTENYIGGGQTGQLTVRNGGYMSAGSVIAFGSSSGGIGTLQVNSGGRLTGLDGVLGQVAGARGFANISGVGSSWSVQNLDLGGYHWSPGAGGTGTLNVSNGGTVNVAATTTLWSPGNSIVIDGGSFTTGALSDYASSGGSILVRNPATGGFGLTVGTGDLSGTFGGQIGNVAGASGSLVKVGNGTLTLGGGSSDTLPNTIGTTYVNSGTLALRKAPGVDAVTNLTIAGGRVLLNSPEQIHDSAAVGVLLNGVLDLNGYTETVRDPVVGSAATIRLGESGMLTVSSVLSSNVQGHIDGAHGTLSKTGNNTLTLSRTSDLRSMLVKAGQLSLWGGNHAVGNAGGVGAGVTVSAGTLSVANGATLDSHAAATSISGSGVVAVGGSGTSWNAGTISVGGTAGQTALNISGGATVSAAGALRFVSPDQTVNIDRARLAVPAITQGTGAGGTFTISDSAAGAALTIGADSLSSTFSGAILDGAGGRGSIRKIGTGSLTLNNPSNNYTGSTIVDAGTLFVAHPLAIGMGTLSISGAGRTVIKAGMFPAPRRMDVEILDNGKLDLNDNDFIVDKHTTQAKVESYVRAARNGGSWDGPAGIASSAAAAHPSHATTIGVLGQLEYSLLTGETTFAGQPLGSSQTLLKYTYYGDTDFNGVVNFDDYVRADNGFNNGLTGWLNGDFDLNGTVNFDDYVLIDLAFNTQNGTLGRALALLDGSDRSSGGMTGAALQQVADHFGEFGDAYARSFVAAVPEPCSPIAGGIGILAAMIRRRRRSR